MYKYSLKYFFLKYILFTYVYMCLCINNQEKREKYFQDKN